MKDRCWGDGYMSGCMVWRFESDGRVYSCTLYMSQQEEWKGKIQQIWQEHDGRCGRLG